jgi:transposase
MEVTYPNCAGLDVHKKIVVGCCITTVDKQECEIRTFGTMTQDLLALSDWLNSKGVTHVAMESTGEFWKPVYNLLEANFTVLVVNAQHIKNVPGRKTDVKDAQWIAQLLRHGLLCGSFIPPLPQRDLRDLTRQRTNLVREKASVVNRLQKVLEWANLKLTSVVTDVTGVSARQMLVAIVEGQEVPHVLAQLAKGKLRRKQQELEQALSGRIREHHRFLIANHLTHIDFLDEQIAVFEHKIAEYIQQTTSIANSTQSSTAKPSLTTSTENSLSNTSTLSWEKAVSLLDTIPGVARQTAELLLAEIGTDMSRFPSSAHLAKWARLCPGNNQSAGKRYSGSIGQGNNWLRSALVQAANAAARCKNTYLSAVYRRLATRRGRNRAIIAVAHRILTAIYHMLSKQQPFHDLGALYLDERRKNHVVKRMCHHLQQLGYQIHLEPITTISTS